MKESEIIEGNKLIAEFMGWKIDYRHSSFTDGKPNEVLVSPDGKTVLRTHNELYRLQYYESWDWLMPVVEKIVRGNAFLRFKIMIQSNIGYTDIVSVHPDMKNIITINGHTTIQHTWLAAVAFIKLP